MKAIEITDIPKEVLKEYGVLYNLTDTGIPTNNTHFSSGEGYIDSCTDRSVIDTVGTLGYTLGSPAPFVCSEMERHLHSEEAQIPAGEPICLCLAKASDNPPRPEEIMPVIIRPGYVFVLHRAVWHSASHGLSKPAYYYWLCWAYKNEPTVWKTINGDPVSVEVD